MSSEEARLAAEVADAFRKTYALMSWVNTPHPNVHPACCQKRAKSVLSIKARLFKQFCSNLNKLTPEKQVKISAKTKTALIGACGSLTQPECRDFVNLFEQNLFDVGMNQPHWAETYVN